MRGTIASRPAITKRKLWDNQVRRAEPNGHHASGSPQRPRGSDTAYAQNHTRECRSRRQCGHCEAFRRQCQAHPDVAPGRSRLRVFVCDGLIIPHSSFIISSRPPPLPVAAADKRWGLAGYEDQSASSPYPRLNRRGYAELRLRCFPRHLFRRIADIGLSSGVSPSPAFWGRGALAAPLPAPKRQPLASYPVCIPHSWEREAPHSLWAKKSGCGARVPGMASRLV
jgi:hypothetical protein